MTAKRKGAKAKAEPKGSIPRKKREVPEHIRRAADRAEAMADGRPAPEPEGPVPEAVAATRAARRRAERPGPRRAAAGPPPGEPAAGADVPAPGGLGGAREGAGRPEGADEYRPEYVDRVRAMVGAVTMFDVAEELGVSERTVYRWKRIHTDFCQAITDKRDNFDDEVEHSFAEQALGYYVDDIHFSSFQGIVTQTRYTKKVPGNVTAQQKWLAARRPDKWGKIDGQQPVDDPLSQTDRSYLDAGRKVLALMTLMGEALAKKAERAKVIDVVPVGAGE